MYHILQSITQIILIGPVLEFPPNYSLHSIASWLFSSI